MSIQNAIIQNFIVISHFIDEYDLKLLLNTPPTFHKYKKRFDAMCLIRVNNKGGIKYADSKL